jgi:hypothetical protein
MQHFPFQSGKRSAFERDGSLHHPWVARVLGLVAVAGFGAVIVSRAGQKPFWFDEALEIFHTCATSYASLLVHGGAGQCSPAPLYYLVQKLLVAQIGLSAGILYTFRTISMVSAVLTLSVLFVVFTRYLGLVWGMLALLALTYSPLFVYFAAENRPYLLWVGVFTATLLLVASLAAQPWEAIRIRAKLLLGVLLVALTLVAGGGMVQALGFLAVLSLWHASLNVRRWTTHPACRFQLALGILCSAIGIYYALHGCLQGYYRTGIPVHGLQDLDLLRTGNWQLVLRVVNVFWPWRFASCRAETDPCGIVTWGFNLCLLVAAVVPVLWWKHRHVLSKTQQFLLSVSLTSLTQVVCAVLLGLLVAKAHYYFIPRVFLYLTVLRVVLIVVGGYLCFVWLAERLRTRVRRGGTAAVHWVLLAGIVMMLAGRLSGLHQDAKQGGREPPLVLTQTICPPARSALALVMTAAPSAEAKLNFVVAFDKHVHACGWVAAAQPTVYVVPHYAPDTPTAGYTLTEALPPSASILGFMHQPLPLKATVRQGDDFLLLE